MSDKNLVVLSSPETEEKWPHPPQYVSRWTYEDLVQMAKELKAGGDVLATLVDICFLYDKDLSAALFRIWQLEGLLKGRK